MAMIFSNPIRESEPNELPDVEVFYQDGDEAGWYYWFCFPGCLPDGEPVGPFDTEAEATNEVHRVTQE